VQLPSRIDLGALVLVGAVVSDFTKEELALGERLFVLQPDSPWTAFCEMRGLFGAMSLERRQELYDVVVAKRRAEARIRNKVEGACCIHPVERHAYNGCADCGCAVCWTEHPDRDLDMSPSAIEARAFRLSKHSAAPITLAKADIEHTMFGCLVEDIDAVLKDKDPREIAEYALGTLSNASALIQHSWSGADHDADMLRQLINIAKYAIDKAVPR
jgi:hypothetical protein